jgi:hypothetical protein
MTITFAVSLIIATGWHAQTCFGCDTPLTRPVTITANENDGLLLTAVFGSWLVQLLGCAASITKVVAWRHWWRARGLKEEITN